MKKASNRNRSFGTAVGTAALVVFSLGFTGAAQARANVFISVGVGLPGVQMGVPHAFPVYAQPYRVYVQPAPTYIQPQPIFYGNQPVYVTQQPVYYGAQPVYVQSEPIYYARRHPHWDRGGHPMQLVRPGDGRGYDFENAPAYYRR